jgi:hypothetical protein
VFTVRKYQNDDFPAVVALIAPAYGPGGDLGYEWPPDEIERYARIYAATNGLCFVAVSGINIIGVALAYVLRDDPGVVHIEVIEPSQGSTAAVLIDAIETKAAERRLKGLRPKDAATLKLVLLVPPGPRTQTVCDKGFGVKQEWNYCEKPLG